MSDKIIKKQLELSDEENAWKECKFLPPDGTVYRHFLSDGEEFIYKGKLYSIRVKEKKSRNKKH